jgi:hypothetical protein
MELTTTLSNAFTLTAALAWNEAAKVAVKQIADDPDDTFRASLVYAVTVTIFVLFIIWLIQKGNNVIENHLIKPKKAKIAKKAKKAKKDSQSGKDSKDNKAGKDD